MKSGFAIPLTVSETIDSASTFTRLSAAFAQNMDGGARSSTSVEKKILLANQFLCGSLTELLFQDWYHIRDMN